MIWPVMSSMFPPLHCANSLAAQCQYCGSMGDFECVVFDHVAFAAEIWFFTLYIIRTQCNHYVILATQKHSWPSGHGQSGTT